MYPLGHIGIALIIATLFYMPLAAFVLGSILPDIFDKSLAIAGLIPCGRSFAHNVFFAIAAGAVAFGITRRKGVGIALALGVLLHLAQDAYYFVPYLYQLVQYDFGDCGPVTFTPNTINIAFEVVGLALIIVWWRFRPKLFYLRERILKLKRLKRVFG